MAKVKTVKEIIFDMMYETYSLMDIVTMYNEVAVKSKNLPAFSLNIYQNINSGINEDEYSKDEPLICEEDGKTVSRTNIEFVTQYFPKALKSILKDYDLDEEYDDVIYEDFIRRITMKVPKLKNLDITTMTEAVFNPDNGIIMDGNITVEMLLENMLDNINLFVYGK